MTTVTRNVAAEQLRELANRMEREPQNTTAADFRRLNQLQEAARQFEEGIASRGFHGSSAFAPGVAPAHAESRDDVARRSALEVALSLVHVTRNDGIYDISPKPALEKPVGPRGMC